MRSKIERSHKLTYFDFNVFITMGNTVFNSNSLGRLENEHGI